METKDTNQETQRPKHYAGASGRELLSENLTNRIEEAKGYGDPRSPQDRAIDHLRERLSYHRPGPGQPERYQALRDAAAVLGTAIIRNCPMSTDTQRALDHLEDTLMKANKSIALGG